MEKLTGPQRKLALDILLVATTLLTVGILSVAGMTGYLNGKLADILVTSRHPVPEHRGDIVFACIDQTSIDFFHEHNDISWPWPRVFYARLLRYLADSGARAVVFDIIFSESDVDRTGEEGDSSDMEFAAAITETGIAHLAVSDRTVSGLPRNTDGSDWYLSNPGPFARCDHIPLYTGALLPYRAFLAGNPGLGFVNMTPDRDGIHRRYPLVSRVGGKLAPSLALSVAQSLLAPGELETRVIAPLDDHALLDREGKVLVNWYGRGGTDPAGIEDYVFTYYSFHAIIVSSIQIETGSEPAIPRKEFEDKIVFVGSNAPGLLDLKATPFTHQNLYPGMEIHATMLANLLDGDYLSRVTRGTLLVLSALAAGILLAVDRRFKSLRVLIAIYAVMMVVIIGAGFLLIHRNLMFTAAEPLLAATFVFMTLIITGYFSESKDKRLLRRQFERYVNDTVLNELMEHPDVVDLKGRTMYATVMATDIAGFTTISEKLAPHEVVSQLNDYLSDVSESLIDNGAFINKYIGDAILAVFGAFGEPDHQINACLAAVHAAEIITRKIGEAEGSGRDPFVTRFGITSGELTMGNIGSARKTEYTVIGDTVNSAFRLEGLNKFYRTTILTSEHTREVVGDVFEFRLIDILRYKGKVKPVRIYELLGVRGEVPADRLALRDEFERALSRYQAREFESARALFTALANAGDNTAEVFITRCDQFIAEPPPGDWNGVWVMQRK